MEWTIKPAKKSLKGEIIAPPDKSVSHRAVMFSSIAKGRARIENFLLGEDCMRTLEAFKAMGVEITLNGSTVLVSGKGLKGLSSPNGTLYMGNSGTSMRVISGILAGQNFKTTLTGDESLSHRPMKRIMEPLRLMGAEILSDEGNFPPLVISPAKVRLKAIDYKTPVPSAQVKSCILSAGLYADGVTSVTEAIQSRDHTERMLEYLGADIKRENLTTKISGKKELTAKDINVPGDISSAAFFIVAALIVPGSDIVVKNVGINPTRTGIITVLKRMGARLEVINVKEGVEPAGDIHVKFSELKGTIVTPEEIPLLIDEIPVLAVAASCASGETIFQEISELKVKESDRVKSIIHNLSKMGVQIYEEKNNLIIPSAKRDTFWAAKIETFADHRIAMSMAIAALLSDGECLIDDTACVETSYPAFLRDLKTVQST